MLCGSALRAETETAVLDDQWSVWSCWYWPFNATVPPNLYDSDEALARYDSYAGTSSQSWEYDHHGPGLNQSDWGGHCHAWAGASVWEYCPLSSRICGGITFRPRDIAALMTEAYYNDTLGTEISYYLPSPGLVWSCLRQEILGQNAMHGHPMSVIGNLTQIRGQVWNYPIFQYRVDYSADPSGDTYSGTLTIWFADDGDPSFADPVGLSPASITYSFSAVLLDQSQQPLDSGSWAGDDPSQYPTTIWRPYFAASWDSYLANPDLDGAHLAPILDVLGLGDAVNAPLLKWATLGDTIWQAETTVSHDLVSAAQSGVIGPNQSSVLQTSVNGPGNLSFWWKVSSAPDSGVLTFLVDGQAQTGSISGEVDWQLMTYAVSGPGTHTLAWIYAKDAGQPDGSDCGWLDEVSWTPAVISNTVAITVSPPEGGSATGAGTFLGLTNITVSATPNPGYAFVNWTAGGTVVSASSDYTFAATNCDLTANFAAVVTPTPQPTVCSNTVTITVSPPEGGSATGAGTFLGLTNITVSATPNTGYAFVNWTAGGTVVGTSSDYTFAVTNCDLIANFAAVVTPTPQPTVNSNTVTITVSPPEGGSATGAGTYLGLTNVIVSATPNPGYAFVNWTADGAVVSSSSDYTFTATNCDLTANFAAVVTPQPMAFTNIVTVSVSPPEGGSAMGGGTFVGLTNVTVSAMPNPGYTFVNWTVGDTVTSTSSNYTFTSVASLNLVANFGLSGPALAIARTNGQLVISWDTNFPNWLLEYCTNAMPPLSWSPLPADLAPGAGVCCVTNPIAGDFGLFRLRQP
jgi:hypothetical protein